MQLHQTPTESLLHTIGNTPLVRLRTAPPDVSIYAKLETFNPGASVKDRLGRYMLERLLERGDIAPGGTIIEPTAGNTGIGMAIAANQLDLEAIFVVPRGFSTEKEILMEALGAEIIHVPNEAGMRGAGDVAAELAAEQDDAVVPQQFKSELNVEAHAETTGPEVLRALDERIGALVVGIGSGGTLMGMAKAIRANVPDVHVVAVEPEGSTFGRLRGCTREEAPYKTEGIGTHDPSVAPLLDPSNIDDIMTISDRAAHAELKRLAREAGHLVGSSAGAASVAAHRVAETIADGSIEVPHDSVVTVFPDSSERYLSKHIYGDFDKWEGKG